MHGLRFTRYWRPGQFATIDLPLAAEDGRGACTRSTSTSASPLTTGRADDIGRFKVPLLRGVIDNAPYFHDNSMDTIEDVVEYFDGPQYASSPDGQRFAIHMSANQKADLVAFLYQL